MFLKKIALTNFRNYSKQSFKFKTPITVLVGDNAQGKSNFLESIYFLATSKSPRAQKDEELVKQGESVVRVEGTISNVIPLKKGIQKVDSRPSVLSSGSKDLRGNDNKEGENDNVQLEVAMQLIPEKGLTKKVKVNGIPRRIAEYSENLAVVLFSPEDINLVIGSPSDRRYHLDQVISQADKAYKKTLSGYEDVVIRKNRILKKLKDGFGKEDELSFWTDQQLMLALVLTQKREEFFEFINKVERKLGQFSYLYIKNELSADKLKNYLAREIEATTSLIGPHRDDFAFLLNDKGKSFDVTQDDSGRDLSRFGSRGEQRTAVLDLKIAEVSFMESKLGKRPILLLDDIFSELDLSHRQHVIDLVKLQPTIIAAVELNNFLKKNLKDAETIYVENGQLSEKLKSTKPAGNMQEF